MCESAEIPEDVQAHGEGQCEWTVDDVTAALRNQCPMLLPGLREAIQERSRQKDAEEKKCQDQLKAIGKCPMGFDWLKKPGGWQCAGGAHFVTDAELKERFGTNVKA